MKHMHVYVNGKLTVIDHNSEWTLNYWTERKRISTSKIRWEIR